MINNELQNDCRNIFRTKKELANGLHESLQRVNSLKALKEKRKICRLKFELQRTVF